MANVYILTKENRAYNEAGIKYVLDTLRNHFNDYSDAHIAEGPLYNMPDVLSQFLKGDPEHSYVVVSHSKGIVFMYDLDDINRFVDLLEANADEDETSWSIIMKALELL